MFNSALDILEEINLSTGRRNNFSEAALERLLDNNLSQKYSQMGYLSSSNVITDGFYDYGKVSYFKLLCLETVKFSSSFWKSKRTVAKASIWLPKITLLVFLLYCLPGFIIISFVCLSLWWNLIIFMLSTSNSLLPNLLPILCNLLSS